MGRYKFTRGERRVNLCGGWWVGGANLRRQEKRARKGEKQICAKGGTNLLAMGTRQIYVEGEGKRERGTNCAKGEICVTGQICARGQIVARGESNEFA